MKYLNILSLVLVLFLIKFIDKNESIASTINYNERASSYLFKDRDEIQILIIQMLKWSNSSNSINLLPTLIKDSICIGFDLDLHKLNLRKLKETNFFATEFIENYNQIILELDKKAKDKKFEVWNVCEIPPFAFSSDVDPWCLCQDNLPWESVEVRVVNLNTEDGELYWKWGNLSSEFHSSWGNFEYQFRVVKENQKWKIAYLQGFDLKQSISWTESNSGPK